MNNQNQKMRVWWCPQVGGCEKHFYIPVHSVEEAKKIMDVLAYYDCYQMNQNVKGDYANCGGLEVWDEIEQEWCDWWYEDENHYFDDIDDYIEAMSDKKDELETDMSEMASQVHFDY